MRNSTIFRGLILIGFCFMLNIAVLSANSLDITPAAATQGSNLTLEYHIDKGKMPEKVTFILYSYINSELEPTVVEIAGTAVPASSLYRATVILPSNIEYGIFSVESFIDGKFITENNHSQYWDVLIVNTAGMPIQNTNMLAAVSYMGSSAVNREANFAKAIELLNQEIKLYPNNLLAQIGLTSLMLDVRKLTFDEFKQEMESHLEKPLDLNSEREVTARVRALKTLGLAHKSKELAAEFTKTHLFSALAEEEVLNQLAAADNLKRFATISKEFITNFPNSNRRNEVIGAIVKAFLQNNDMAGLEEFMRTSAIESPDIYLAIAQTILTNNKVFPGINKNQRIDTATTLFNKALFIQKDLYQIAKMGPKPESKKSISTTSYRAATDQKMSFFYEVGGDIYILRDSVEALKSYKMALALNDDNDNVELYRKLYNLYAGMQDCPNAYATIEAAIIHSAFFENIDQLFRGAYLLCKNGTEESTDIEYQKLLDSARKLRLDQLSEIELQMEVQQCYMKNLDDRVIELSDFKGSTTILFFQSSWCGPCQATIPALEDLYEFYKGDANVQMASVGVWEESTDRKDQLLEYQEEYDLSYPLLYDETDIIMRALSITGLPAAVILDENGIVRFKIAGFVDTETYIREISDMVDYLKSK